ncbi:MAG: HEAT repeat domain-containing protein [Verrucomicrobia bacterium]|nr:HEAT repeat domain-containing protein [Verrucomicrobiota bacterium]
MNKFPSLCWVVFGVFQLSAAEPQTAGAKGSDGPLTPQQALASFRLEPGLRVELVAAEPLVVDPVAIAFDERGRMFVAENRGYPTGPGEGKPPVGIVAVLEDTNGDGRYDKRTVFADNLTFPNGVMPWRGGVFVTCAPDILYFKDIDGDGRADIRNVVLTGFITGSTTQLRVSHPTLAIDNWVYVTSGLIGGKITSPGYLNHPPVETKTDFRFRPDTDEFEAADGKAQFGLTFDDFGHRFICMNRVQVQQVVLPSRYLQRNPHRAFADTVQNLPESMLPEPLKGHGAAARIYPISRNLTTADSHAGTFTAACGVAIYRGTALPEEYRGCAFSCDPTGNLVHYDRLVPTGATFKARRVREGVEFLASTDNWFRPVNLANAPDGALYICDMHRKTIEHPQYLPGDVRKHTDFDSGKGMGRIYRVVAVNQKSKPRIPNLTNASARTLCNELNNPNSWWRETAQRLLIERQDKVAVPLLKPMPKNARSAVARLHALRTLDGLGALGDEQILCALVDSNPGVRENAIQLAEPRLKNSPQWTPRLIALADDPDTRVRFQCALTLGDMDDARIVPALAKIAVRDTQDRWARAAVLSSVGRWPTVFLRAVLSLHATDEGMADLWEELGRMLGDGQSPENLITQLSEVGAAADVLPISDQLTFASGMAQGLRGRGIGGTDRSALASLLATNSPATDSARTFVAKLTDRSLKIASDAQQPLTLRLAAVGLLGQADYSIAGATLLKLVGLPSPNELQIAAVRSLGQMSDPALASALLERERWNSYTPAVREAVLSSLIAKPQFHPPLLTALETKAMPMGAMDSARRKQLTQDRDEAVRQRAAELFKSLQSGDRMKVYEDYKSVLALKPDPKNGRAVFLKTCASCHRLDQEGVPVGPDLFGIRSQPKEAMLLHIIVPEYEIMPGFANYTVETIDGRTISGLIASESANNVTLRQALGVEETISRGNIVSISSSSLSLMPQELEKAMSRQDMADLISYLKGE